MDLKKDIKCQFADMRLDPLFQKLSEKDRLILQAELLKYKKIPPTIDQFLDDPYYLGGKDCIGPYVFPAWRRVLRDIFPDPINMNYTSMYFTGAIGCGKSVVSIIVTLYTMCKLMHLKNPWDTFNMGHVKNISFLFCHKSIPMAIDGFISPLREILEGSSPFFQRNPLRAHGLDMIADGQYSSAGVGFDVIGYVLSEIAFYKPELANAKISEANSRQGSRFKAAENLFSFIIYDSSSRARTDPVEEFARSNAVGDLLKIKMPIWESRGHLGIYFKEGPESGFLFYSGDTLHTPQIIEDESKITVDMNRDLVFRCPNELKSMALIDPYKFCTDSLGQPLISTDQFLPHPQAFNNSFKIPHLNPDIITISFNDKADKIIYRVENALDTIPRDSFLFFHLDLGVTNDICGISLCYFSEYMKAIDGVQVPKFKVPLILGLSRLEGEETPLFQILDFFSDLKDAGFQVQKITFDKFQSTFLMQELKRLGFNVDYLSVDRTDKVYNTVKTLISGGQVDFADNKRFRQEVLKLKLVKQTNGTFKVDHDPVTTYLYDEEGNRVPDNGKDLADSVFGSVYNCFQDTDVEKELLSNKATRDQVNSLNNMLKTPREETQKVFNDMISSIW